MNSQSNNTGLFSSLGSKFSKSLDRILAQKNGKALMVVLLSVLLVLVTLGMLALLDRVRQGGVSVEGNTATLTFSPGSSSLTPGTSQSIAIKANIGTASVDGFQVFADITGTLPTNLSFTASNLSGSGLTLITGDIVAATSGTGKTLRILFITAQPTVPFQATGDIELGRLFFTVPASGQMVITPNSTLTKIVDHSTSTNIVTVPAAATYNFVVAQSSSSSSSVSSSASSSTSSAATGVTIQGSTNGGTSYVDGPINLTSGFGVRLQWSATGATSCTATANPANSQWTGTQTTSGTKDIISITQSVTLTITCGSSSDSFVINVSSAASSSSSSTVASSVSTSSTSSAPQGLTCGWLDVDKNNTLDIVDFADFARKYNQSCTQVDLPTTTTFDYQIGQTADVDVKLTNVGTNNAVDVDLAVTNATVLGFTPSSTNGWSGAIGFCNAQQQLFTTNRVCTAITKQTNILEGEVAGKVKLQFNSAGQTKIDRTAAFAYSNGQVKVSNPGNMYTFTVGTSSSTPVSTCGRQDTNTDNLINLIDFSALGRKYNVLNCGIN